MYLVVCIPARNEEKTVGAVVRAVPAGIPGVSRRTVIVVDNGSRDRTAEEARRAGADDVIRHAADSGLAERFRTGRAWALRRAANFFVTLDADGQYDPREIWKLLRPLLDGCADVSIGDRGVRHCRHMPLRKKIGNIMGSGLLCRTFGLPACDASSGFRACNRRALAAMDIAARHTYTHETLIRAHAAGMRIVSVPITFRSRLHGESRLVRSVLGHILLSMGAILRCLFTVRAR